MTNRKVAAAFDNGSAEDGLDLPRVWICAIHCRVSLGGRESRLKGGEQTVPR
jgi:hypothetical protein